MNKADVPIVKLVDTASVTTVTSIYDMDVVGLVVLKVRDKAKPGLLAECY